VATGKYGIPIEDIVIDPLAMPVGADTSLVLTHAGDDRAAARGARRQHDARRLQRVLRHAGARGDRAAFLPMAIRQGLTSAIMDARSPQLVRSVKAADLLLDRDPWGAAWIAAHRAQQAAAAAT
jgi:5-methyltetrahydrofolate--homocysteine methyltransferase